MTFTMQPSSARTYPTEVTVQFSIGEDFMTSQKLLQRDFVQPADKKQSTQE